MEQNKNNEEENANIMDKYFVNATKSLNLMKQITPGNDDTNEFDCHISIKMIHKKYPEAVPESLNLN